MKTIQLEEFLLFFSLIFVCWRSWQKKQHLNEIRVTECVLVKKRETHSCQSLDTSKPAEERRRIFCATWKKGGKKHIYSTVSNICRCFPTHHGRRGATGEKKNTDIRIDISKLTWMWKIIESNGKGTQTRWLLLFFLPFSHLLLSQLHLIPEVFLTPLSPLFFSPICSRWVKWKDTEELRDFPTFLRLLFVSVATRSDFFSCHPWRDAAIWLEWTRRR